jgi:hypothetical protein
VIQVAAGTRVYLVSVFLKSRTPAHGISGG